MILVFLLFMYTMGGGFDTPYFTSPDYFSSPRNLEILFPAQLKQETCQMSQQVQPIQDKVFTSTCDALQEGSKLRECIKTQMSHYSNLVKNCKGVFGEYNPICCGDERCLELVKRGSATSNMMIPRNPTCDALSSGAVIQNPVVGNLLSSMCEIRNNIAGTCRADGYGSMGGCTPSVIQQPPVIQQPMMTQQPMVVQSPPPPPPPQVVQPPPQVVQPPPPPPPPQVVQQECQVGNINPPAVPNQCIQNIPPPPPVVVPRPPPPVVQSSTPVVQSSAPVVQSSTVCPPSENKGVIVIIEPTSRNYEQIKSILKSEIPQSRVNNSSRSLKENNRTQNVFQDGESGEEESSSRNSKKFEECKEDCDKEERRKSRRRRKSSLKEEEKKSSMKDSTKDNDSEEL